MAPARRLELRERWPGRGHGPSGGEAAVELAHVDAVGLAEDLAARGLAGNVRVVYVDPPFLSNAGYVHEARIEGPADGRVSRALAYDDRWEGPEAWLDRMGPALDALAGLLRPDGTIWVHLDWRATYLARCLLDEILGPRAFLNEIVWRRAPNLGRQARSGQFGRTLDTLLVYGGPDAVLRPPTRLEPIAASLVRVDDAGRPFTAAPRGDYTDASVARLEREGRIHRTASGKVYVKYFVEPAPGGGFVRERPVDALWTDVPALRHAPPAERTGYPTQKPEALLARVIGCASDPGDLVVDAFAGSGTTGAVAHALGRRAVVGDASPVAIATTRARLVRAGAAVDVLAAPGFAAPEAAAEVEVELDGAGARSVGVASGASLVAVAVGEVPEAGAPFVPSAFAVRGTGPRPSPLPERLRVDARGPVELRAYRDDGAVARVALPSASPRAKAVPRGRSRAREGVAP